MHLALDARKLTDFGIGTYVEQLIVGLEKREGIDLLLLVRPDHVERVDRLAPSARLLPISAAGYTFAEQIELPMALRGEEVDLVHVPHYVVPPLLLRPVVATIHDVIPLFYPPRRRRQLALWYLRAMVGHALRRSRRTITVSRASRHDLIRFFGADPQRLEVIPQGVDPALGVRPPQPELDELKGRAGLEPPLILVVANDKPHKNLDIALRAFHRGVRERGMAGQLVLVGGVQPGDRFDVRAERLGLGDRVRVLGRVSAADLARLYHLSAVLLHPALYEGFGLPVLEAMRCGLPVVTSNLGALREVGEGAAMLVNPLDVEEVGDAVERVLVDDPLRRRMIDAGRRRADELTWERTVDETVAVYRRALGIG